MKPGFKPHDRKSAVTSPWEPLFSNTEAGITRIGFTLERQHCNSRDMLHGGVIAALADNAMGLSLGETLIQQGGKMPERAHFKGAVTTSLAIDYLGVAELGQWIEIVPRVIRAGGRSGVVDALIYADDKVIARANASFQIIR